MKANEKSQYRMSSSHVVVVETTQYEFSHNHTPRGSGLWAFEIAGETYWRNGNYTVALADARKLAKAQSAGVVIVLP